MKVRKLTPEILDHLPADDPSAIRSRRDLLVINRLAGNFRWLEKSLNQLDTLNGKVPVFELGAGDGAFAKYLATRHPSVDYTALDLAPRPDDFPSQWKWCQQNVFEDFPLADNSVVIANLFLHHFETEQLQQLGDRFSQCRHMLFNEPERNYLYRGLGYIAQTFLRFNHVTRHDMHVSIEAGFKGNELVEMMGLENRNNTISQSPMGFHRLTSSAAIGN